MTLDPITGLDTSIVDPFLYQIPLTTNPIQAPEWGFQGHYDQILHPDNIPAVFATAQGYDESNPGAAQAHHMDGEGNLYVNVRKNEAGGGGSGPVVIVPYESVQTIGGISTKLTELGPIGSVIYGLSVSYTEDCGAIRPDHENAAVRLYMYPASGRDNHLQLAAIPISMPEYGAGQDTTCGHVEIWYGNGMIWPGALDDGNGNYSVYCDCVNSSGGLIELGVWCSA